MARWFAIPLRADGTERLGTDGVLIGEYQSVKTFTRYSLIPYGHNPHGYALYIKTHNGDWIPRGTWKR